MPDLSDIGYKDIRDLLQQAMKERDVSFFLFFLYLWMYLGNYQVSDQALQVI